MHADDGPLFEDAARGDPHALDQLLTRYLPQLHAFVHARLGPQLRARETSLDVVQSVCRELLSARDGFRFQGEDRFRAWLFTAALNKVRERHRRRRSGRRDAARETPDLDPDQLVALAQMLTPSQVAIGHETAAAVHAALADLEEDHREVVTLARIVHLPHRVIAEVMDRSEPAVRQLLARAMLNLARGLQARGIDLRQFDHP